LGLGLVLGGYMVKSAIVPAHTWLPDAHGRAPSSISAMLSGVILQAYLYVLIKAGLGMGMAGQGLGQLLIVLALPTMALGNLMALRQSYGKRLLAYSSIAHSGYMMAGFGLGLFSNRPEPIAAAFFMLAAHAAMKGLAFLCKGIAHLYCDATLLRDLDGLFHRMPLPAACFTVALAGLAGLVPLAGFTAKVVMLQSFFQTGGPLGILVATALVLNSLVALGYYLPMIGRMLRWRHADSQGGGAAISMGAHRPRVSLWMLSPVVVLGIIVLLLGIIPGPLLALASRAAVHLLAWGQGS
jgi:formate hydrogenlyase subunit 3/multisubunit Na+/H+ antiporter MnhD subunit